MRISDYISTVDRIRPDENLRDRICSIPAKAFTEPAQPSRYKRKPSLHLYWLIPAVAILVVLFGGAVIARILMPAGFDSFSGTNSTSNSSGTGMVTQLQTPLVNAFSIKVFAADGTMAPMTEEAVSLTAYQNDTLPGIPFTMDSSVYTDSVISIEADKGTIFYASASDKDFVTYSAGTICTIKAGDTFYWSPDIKYNGKTNISITEKRADVFCSFIRMELAADASNEFSAKIKTVLSAPIENGGTLSVSGKIKDGVYLNASIDPVSAGYYFNPESVGKKYVTHTRSWNDGSFIDAFSEELEGAVLETKEEYDAVLRFEELQSTETIESPIKFWANIGEGGRPAYYNYRYDNGVDIYIEGNFSGQASYSTRTERTAESANGVPMYSFPNVDDCTDQQKASLQQDLSFATRSEALNVIMQKLDKLGIRVSPDYTCKAISSDLFPDKADCYYFTFRLELSGLPLYRVDWYSEMLDKEYTLFDGPALSDIYVKYSEDGIIRFDIYNICQAENSPGCEVSECSIPDILSACDKFSELNGSYTVTDVKLAYMRTSSTFSETDYVATLEPCWAFKVIDNDTGEEMETSEYHVHQNGDTYTTRWFYMPNSMVE